MWKAGLVPVLLVVLGCFLAAAFGRGQEEALQTKSMVNDNSLEGLQILKSQDNLAWVELLKRHFEDMNVVPANSTNIERSMQIEPCQACGKGYRETKRTSIQYRGNVLSLTTSTVRARTRSVNVVEGRNAVVLSCGHAFHDKCLVDELSFMLAPNTCPNCLKKVKAEFYRAVLQPNHGKVAPLDKPQ